MVLRDCRSKALLSFHLYPFSLRWYPLLQSPTLWPFSLTRLETIHLAQHPFMKDTCQSSYSSHHGTLLHWMMVARNVLRGSSITNQTIWKIRISGKNIWVVGFMPFKLSQEAKPKKLFQRGSQQRQESVLALNVSEITASGEVAVVGEEGAGRPKERRNELAKHLAFYRGVVRHLCDFGLEKPNRLHGRKRRARFAEPKRGTSTQIK